MRFIITCLSACMVMLALISTASASNHGSVYANIANSTGIRIAPLVHGQMVVIAEHRNAIVTMAEAYKDDPVVAKLLTYGNTAYAKSLYGYWPTALADADTPFHLPTHAYLASARALLVRLADIAPANAQVASLNTAVDMQMIEQEGTSMSLCAYSTLKFDTSKPIGPDWSHVGTEYHMHALLILVLLLAAASTLVFAAYRRKPTTYVHQLHVS